MGVVLGEEAVVQVIVAGYAPADNHVVAAEGKGAAGSGEVAVVAEHVAVGEFTGVQVDRQAEHSGVEDAIGIVEQGDGVVARVPAGIVLTVEVGTAFKIGASERPEQVAGAALAVDLGNGADVAEGAEPVAVGQDVDGVEVDVVGAGGLFEALLQRSIHRGMVGAPPVELHLAVLDFLQVSGINAIAQDVGREDVVMAVDHAEVVPVDGVALFDETVAAGLQVQGVDGVIMLVGHYAHAGIVAGEAPVCKVVVGDVIAVIGGAADDVFLEVPPPRAFGCVEIFQLDRFVAIVKKVAAVVYFFDKGYIDKRQVEIAG